MRHPKPFQDVTFGPPVQSCSSRRASPVGKRVESRFLAPLGMTRGGETAGREKGKSGSPSTALRKSSDPPYKREEGWRASRPEPGRKQRETRRYIKVGSFPTGLEQAVQAE